jgi:hypothetical protein
MKGVVNVQRVAQNNTYAELPSRPCHFPFACIPLYIAVFLSETQINNCHNHGHLNAVAGTSFESAAHSESPFPSYKRKDKNISNYNLTAVFCGF